MKILVTGASGFIGGEVARLAAADGHEVAVLVRKATVRLPGRVLVGNMEAPPWDAIREFSPEACIHCAWIATPGVYLDSPENETLVESSMALASGLVECGLQHFVGAGTCFEYDSSPSPLHTSAPAPANCSPYAAAKIRLHRQLAEILASKVAFSWGRIFYAYGPREHPKRFPSILLTNFSEGKPVTVNRPRDIVDYIHVRDIAAAFLTIATGNRPGDFNVGSGCPVTVGEVAATAARLTGRNDLLILGQHDDVTGRCADMACWDGLPWSPQISLEDGLREMMLLRQ
ncbi:MAG: NAD(P)-dependent oxidoreductase [Terrimicrobiaceae bacterium]